MQDEVDEGGHVAGVDSAVAVDVASCASFLHSVIHGAEVLKHDVILLTGLRRVHIELDRVQSDGVIAHIVGISP